MPGQSASSVDATSPRIIFRVAAGPRIGSGHLVRALRLAELTGCTAYLSLRGPRASALHVHARVPIIDAHDAGAALALTQPALLVVDDPCERAGLVWLEAARSRGCPTVGLLDFGIGSCGADLAIDGSVARPVRRAAVHSTLSGPRFAVTDPSIAGPRRFRPPRRRPLVFISLGGGYRTAYARRLARLLRRESCETDVVVAGGFVRSRMAEAAGIRLLGPEPSIVPWLRAATLAIVAGGITLYEACALGVPTIAVPVTDPQRRPIAAMRRLGAVAGPGGRRPGPPSPRVVARRVVSLLRAHPLRVRLATRGPAIVDGKGPFRVSDILRQLASGSSPAAVFRRHATVRVGEFQR